MRARRLSRVGAFVWAAFAAAPALPSPRDEVLRWCTDDERAIPAYVERRPVPVGCAVVDCCPGCPASKRLDWRVRIAGETVGALTIDFEGLAADSPASLEGDARATATGVRVGPAGATIRGLGADGDHVAFATLRLALDRAQARAQDAMPRAIDVSIEQLLGPVVVNEHHLHFALGPCVLPPFQACDSVQQQSNRGGDRSVVLLDGRRGGGCADDVQYRSDASVDVGNFLASAATCRSETFIFSSGDAMAMRAPETAWSDGCGDQAIVPMAPALAAPVTVWIASVFETEDSAKADVANANFLYDRNKTGISFDARYAQVPGPARLPFQIGCLGAPASHGYYDAGRLNVYYIDTPTTGETCDADPNRVYVGSLGNLATLAHEFGHAFSLFGDETTGGHTNGLANFTSANVMWGGGPPTRDHFSLGQAFRFNVDSRSQLNVDGVRNGPTRSCPALGPPSDACPRLDLDWSRP